MKSTGGACYYRILLEIFKRWGGGVGDRGKMKKELKETEGWLGVTLQKYHEITGHGFVTELHDELESDLHILSLAIVGKTWRPRFSANQLCDRGKLLKYTRLQFLLLFNGHNDE